MLNNEFFDSYQSQAQQAKWLLPRALVAAKAAYDNNDRASLNDNIQNARSCIARIPAMMSSADIFREIGSLEAFKQGEHHEHWDSDDQWWLDQLRNEIEARDEATTSK